MQHPPIEYDEFGFVVSGDAWPDDDPETAPAATGRASLDVWVEEPHVPIRQQFPPPGEHNGGTSDGWEYRTVFAGGRLESTYQMVRHFLNEEGYGDVPVPETAEELRLFRKQRTSQLQLFPERGYIHNPVKILFHSDPKQRNTLIVCVYNEQAPQHLLRFHGVVLV